jgi:hypothetical protein
MIKRHNSMEYQDDSCNQSLNKDAETWPPVREGCK